MHISNSQCRYKLHGLAITGGVVEVANTIHRLFHKIGCDKISQLTSY